MKTKSLVVILTISILITAVVLGGCGFTLRSQRSLPTQLHGTYLQTEQPYGQIELALKKELQAAGIMLAPNALNAPLTLELGAINFSYSSDTQNSLSTQARVYHLTLSTTVSLRDNQGKVLLEPETINANRDLILGVNEIFASSTQVDRVKENMQRELLSKIFAILGSQRVREALELMHTARTQNFRVQTR